MNWMAIVTILTTVFSVAVKVVGMPDQIKYNHRRKSTAGLSGWFMLSTLISYVLWTVHGVQVHDMSLVIGQGLGIVVAGIIVLQMWAYRKTTQTRRAKSPNARYIKAPLLFYSLMQATIFRRYAKSEVPIAGDE